MAWARCTFNIPFDPRRLKMLIELRFVLTSTQEIKTQQTKEAEDVKKELANLDKKLHYLETTYKNSQEHIEAILKRGG